MNILILNWRDPKHPLAGGAERMVLEHSKYWIKNGANVYWFASNFKNAKENEIIENINIIRRGNQYTVFFNFFLYKIRNKLENIDIVVDCFHFIPFFTPVYIRKQKVIALIHEVADNMWFSNLPPVLAYIGYKLEPYFLSIYKNNFFITVSNSTKKDLIKHGIKSRKIFVLPNGVIIPKMDRNIVKEKYPTLVYLGRISKDKGIEDLLYATMLLNKKIKNLKLWIIGKAESKNYERQFKKIINKYKLKNCQWFGYVDEKKKFELLKRSWILIHPSSREGWGMNVIESNAMGTPAIGYLVPGLIDSIKHNKTGLLVKPGIYSLVIAVLSLVKDTVKYKNLSDNAIDWSKNFTWKKSCEKSFEILKKL